MNFWDSNVWGIINLFAVLLASLLAANLLKKSFRFLRQSLIPTSVLGGLMLLIVSGIYQTITGDNIFNIEFFAGTGQQTLEVITYHFLALGFIASSLKSSDDHMTKKRAIEIFDTGVTTVSGYMIQGIVGFGITMIAALVIKDFFPVAGLLLPFGYGQGTGQALNYGGIYEADFGFVGGRSFGLTIAAMGFLCAAIGGVIYLNVMKKKGLYKFSDEEIIEALNSEDIQSQDEVPMNGSIDKMSIQLAIIFGAYAISYVIIRLLSGVIPGFRSVLYGFNFLIGVLVAIAIRKILQFLREKKMIEKQYLNPFLLSRITGFCFDVMIVAGFAAIQIQFLKETWEILLILGIAGMLVTYFYVKFVCNKLFPAYKDEQFLAMYGMLTGTASTGMILLREVDPEYKGPVAENLVLQQVPAMVFGFPLMLLATMAPRMPFVTWLIIFGLFVVMQIILFRRTIKYAFIKGKRSKKAQTK